MSETTPELPVTCAIDGLAALLAELGQGPWRFIQLRGAPLGAQDVDAGDVDFLGTRASVNALLGAAFAWVREGRCHLRVRSRDPNKTVLILISPDGGHAVSLDLWVGLWQLDGGKACLRYEQCEHLLTTPEAAIRRLPVAVEACLYVHHLVTKKKVLASERVQARLAGYVAACADSGEAELAQALGRIAEARHIDAGDLALCNGHLGRLGLAGSGPRWPGKLAAELRAAWLDAPRKTRCVAIMGCDGSGKTSLARELQKQAPSTYFLYTGKHLYRKSLLYKLATIFIRPLLFQPREQFDETLAPWNYLRASIALQLKLWFSRSGMILMDRSIVDFLVVARKTDRPRFHRARWLAALFGRRIASVHVVVPEDSLQERKQEMTRPGHAEYDRLMFEHFSQRVPTDYCAFYNGASLEDSRQVLGRLLTRLA
ncbi:MAG: hypothetical protein HGA75_02900 [Thiobacillus sp.]|nr:hypothetical protein [Thiobacillus sp.]